MSVVASSIPAISNCDLRAATPIGDAFASIRRRMMLDFCKWDPQVEDVSTLADFPLILSRAGWRELRWTAEALARETLAMETPLLERLDLHGNIGLPSPLRSVLRRTSNARATPAAVRVMRFDFHPTSDGWRISEVNSDVPGGFSEASAFSEMVAECASGFTTAGNPQDAYVHALGKAALQNGGVVALLAAPGFMEDLQVVSGLAKRLREMEIAAVITEPRNLRWIDGHAFLRTAANDEPIGAVVRFYQGEWLANLSVRVQWSHLFVGGTTPVANPGSAILTESKRLPLVWDELGVACPAWKRVLPETRDPRDAPWRRDDEWLLKTAYCNTGDSVTVREFLPAKSWRRRSVDVWLRPRHWLAQRRFETLAVQTPMGSMFPCIGVYTIDGTACGIYGRLSRRPIINYEAIDVAVLIDQQPREAR